MPYATCTRSFAHGSPASSSHVQTLVEVVVLLAPYCGGYVPCGVQAAAVAFYQQAGRHAVVGQIHHLCPLTFRHKPLFLQHTQGLLHFVVVEAFAVPAVEMHVQTLVDTLYLRQRYLLEKLKQPGGFGVALLDFYKPLARLLRKRGIFRLLLVEFHVQPLQFGNALLFHALPVPPQLERHYHFAELRAVVAQMVNAHHVVAQRFVYLVQTAAYRRSGEVSYVE